mgnify:CR=1 FL=1
MQDGYDSSCKNKTVYSGNVSNSKYEGRKYSQVKKGFIRSAFNDLNAKFYAKKK